MPAPQNYKFAFTSFETDPPLFDPEEMHYLVYGKEICPDTGRPHWQSHVEFKKKKTYSGVRKFYPYLATNALSVVRDVNKSIAYCKKDGEFVEHGSKPTSGQRSDLVLVKNRLIAGEKLSDLALDDECAEVVARHMTYFRSIASSINTGKGLSALKTQLAGVSLRPWQQSLVDIVSAQPDPRHVHWFWDSTGNVGKSFMASYLSVFHGAAVFSGGKVSDIAHAYNMEPVVIFDLSRTQEDHLAAVYSSLESFKNGRFFSPKYESQVKLFPVPHVVCFANYEPDKTKLSLDRWKVHHIVTV